MINILIVLCFASAVIAASNEDLKKWENFKTKYGKVYTSKNEEKIRMNNFLKNNAEVERINEKFATGEIMYTASVYSHHDLSTEEFKTRYLGTKPPKITNPRIAPMMRQYRRASLDLSATREVNPIRNERNCSADWAYAATASAESRYYRNSNKTKTIDLSEQQLVECVYPRRNGCDGGWFTDAFDWIKINGQTKESNIPYTGRYSGNCTKPSADFLINRWGTIPNSVDLIKSSLNDEGVLSIGVDASNWGSYKSGVFFSPHFNGVNRWVNLVGYGSEDFGVEYWKIRNSWGAEWGEKGYIRVSINPPRYQYSTYDTQYTYSLSNPYSFVNQ